MRMPWMVIDAGREYAQAEKGDGENENFSHNKILCDERPTSAVRFRSFKRLSNKKAALFGAAFS